MNVNFSSRLSSYAAQSVSANGSEEGDRIWNPFHSSIPQAAPTQPKCQMSRSPHPPPSARAHSQEPQGKTRQGVLCEIN